MGDEAPIVVTSNGRCNSNHSGGTVGVGCSIFSARVNALCCSTPGLCVHPFLHYSISAMVHGLQRLQYVNWGCPGHVGERLPPPDLGVTLFVGGVCPCCNFPGGRCLGQRDLRGDSKTCSYPLQKIMR